jgi:hypothetical protein
LSVFISGTRTSSAGLDVGHQVDALIDEGEDLVSVILWIEMAAYKFFR